MAAWVTLTATLEWVAPGGRSMKSFPPGDHYLTEDQATEAERQGVGSRRVERPKGAKVGKDGQTHAS
jgi:hypothetical protein